eukprot:3496007-Pleurochrysis_carterae.AAC.7
MWCIETHAAATGFAASLHFGISPTRDQQEIGYKGHASLALFTIFPDMSVSAASVHKQLCGLAELETTNARTLTKLVDHNDQCTYDLHLAVPGTCRGNLGPSGQVSDSKKAAIIRPYR